MYYSNTLELDSTYRKHHCHSFPNMSNYILFGLYHYIFHHKGSAPVNYIQLIHF